MTKKETYWLIGTSILILTLNLIIFRFHKLQSYSTINIQVNDSYFVFSNFQFAALLGVLIFFGIYLIRTINWNFKNFTMNLILMISTILLLLYINGMITLLGNFIHQKPYWTAFPPMTGAIEDDPSPKPFTSLSNALFYTQIILTIFLAFCGFKTGQNYKQSD